MNLITAKNKGSLFLLNSLFLILVMSSCNVKPESQPLPISVSSTLGLLQENPQFVMYLNFKNMRRSDFWKKNVSDSLLNAEKTFGSLLNTFKTATGASISDGLDELYYSNSWFGENAIVIKGVLDQNKLAEYLEKDTVFTLAKNADGIKVYQMTDNGLYFYFRDNNTICASNYLKQLDVMLAAKDTSRSGILLNEKVYSSIQNIMYKEDMWMISSERIFIRGIFQNFLQSTAGTKIEESDSTQTSDSVSVNDSASVKENLTIENLYKRFSSISFSAKMSNQLEMLVQCECINEESSKYLRNILNGVISVAKLSSAGNKKSNSMKILDDLKLNRYDNSVFIELNVNENNIRELRNANLLNAPE